MARPAENLDEFALQTLQTMKNVFERPRYQISIVNQTVNLGKYPGVIRVKFLCYDCEFDLEIAHSHSYSNKRRRMIGDLRVNVTGANFWRTLRLDPTSPSKIRRWTVFLCKDLIMAGVKSLMES